MFGEGWMAFFDYHIGALCINLQQEKQDKFTANYQIAYL